jgi:hypothetical protein
MEDLPKFEMGYKQNIGDIMAGGQSSYKDIAEQTRIQKTGSGFQSSGAGSAGTASAKKEIQSGVETGRRREVESWQGDLLSAIDRIQGEAGFEFGAEERKEALPTYGAPAGWPTGDAYQQWLNAGGDPNNATMYGWQATVPGATPGYKA